MIRVVDDLARSVELLAPARRIVSLVPSLTETLFALGRGRSLVGITRYCVEPVGEVDEIAKVGGTKNPDLRAIIDLKPDLVIVNAEENRRPDFEALVAAGLRVFVSYPHRVRDVGSLMHRLGEVVGAQATAAALIHELEDAIQRAEGQISATSRRVFCPIWKNPWMTFNADTYADDMLNLVGARNICADLAQRYPVVELAKIADLDPELVLLPDEPYVFAEKDLPSLDPLQETTALRTGQVHFIDGKALSWYGPRTATAINSLRRSLGSSVERPHE